MERLILMGNFIFCPLYQSPVLGIECQECEFITEIEGNYFCSCDEDKKPVAEELEVKEIINILLDLLDVGQRSIEREKLREILDL